MGIISLNDLCSLFSIHREVNRAIGNQNQDSDPGSSTISGSQLPGALCH